MTINLDEYKEGEPITIILHGMQKTFYDTNILVPLIEDKHTSQVHPSSFGLWEHLRFKMEIYGKDVEISKIGNN